MAAWDYESRMKRTFGMPRRPVATLLLAGALAGGCDATSPLDPIAPAQPVDSARVRIIVPEAYELANVIVAMTTYSQSNSILIWTRGEYYARVLAAFAPFRTHVAMQLLQLGNDDPLRRYYELRDNSFAYVFDADLLKRDPAYGTLWSPNTFRDRLVAVQLFSDASHFRSFYAANAAYYDTFIERYRALADIDSIADWLEREFAPHRFDHYTVALSPLVYGSHSTHQVTTSRGREAIMFVSGPDVTSGPTAGVQRATVQRLVFTEIDHNFVNPVTDQYRSRVENAFGTRSQWTTDNSSFYGSPVAVFNEYMTWAVFLLYIEGRVGAEDFIEVVRRTTTQMEGSRRFQRFGMFAQELLRLYHHRPAGSRVAALYPAMLEWAEGQ
jgi:hypothetical protein